MQSRSLVAPAAGLVGAGLATLAYAGLIERNAFRLRELEVPVLAPGADPLRLLHLSDLHLTSAQKRKREWIRRLGRLEPDLVVVTGDFLAGMDAVGPVLAALEPLLERPGAFVPGNNDYYAPRAKNPLRYFVPEKNRVFGARLPWPDLATAMTDAGWVDVTNRRATLKAGDRVIALAGTDDPHLGRDRYAPAPADPSADLRLGVTHSPEPRVLDAFTADGYELILAGHTHGGQLRVPGYGAIVTNCGIDRARARGLSRWDDRAWLHVSPGLGTSPYAPVRFCCPPEATLLKLVPRLG
ncbi:MAG TPA: metallophosphoesterase [Mycobacteriales bacterium]|jgi:predicted MPP superfamily phosphohydrolase|nr:metallophosphoesterase [Mycobacteriales bacterium]